MPCARCHTLDEALSQEQLEASGSIQIQDHPLMGKLRTLRFLQDLTGNPYLSVIQLQHMGSILILFLSLLGLPFLGLINCEKRALSHNAIGQNLSLGAVRRGKRRWKPCFILSGTGADLRVKPNVLDSPLAKSFRVIVYDQRGLGQTQKPFGPYEMEDYSNDAIALLDKLDIDNVHLVGVSLVGW